MKILITILVIGILMLGAGIGILLSDTSGTTTEDYSRANGKVLLTHDEYETFKADLVKQKKVNLKDIEVMNSGELYIVQLNNLSVDKDFKYGDVTVVLQKYKSSETWRQVEIVLIILGIVITTISFFLISEELANKK
jgi:hypothetical protein